jgi:hypothetical protein
VQKVSRGRRHRIAVYAVTRPAPASVADAEVDTSVHVEHASA